MVSIASKLVRTGYGYLEKAFHDSYHWVRLHIAHDRAAAHSDARPPSHNIPCSGDTIFCSNLHIRDALAHDLEALPNMKRELVMVAIRLATDIDATGFASSALDPMRNVV
jgi:hypothetical protein